jgi:hypothetical protein
MAADGDFRILPSFPGVTGLRFALEGLYCTLCSMAFGKSGSGFAREALLVLETCALPSREPEAILGPRG